MITTSQKYKHYLLITYMISRLIGKELIFNLNYLLKCMCY